MAGPAADEMFLYIDDDEDGPALLGGCPFTASDIEGAYRFETPSSPPRPSPRPVSPFYFNSDDHEVVDLSPSSSAPWAYILDYAPGGGGSGSGTGTGGGEEEQSEIVDRIQGLYMGDASFAEQPPEQVPEDDIFAYVDLEPVPQDDEVVPEHVGPAVGGAPPAAREAVEQLDQVAVSREEAAQECTICRCEFEHGDLATRLPCRHLYHAECIRKWLEIRNSCPICRDEMPTDDPKYEEQQARRRSDSDGASSSTGEPGSPV